jgi:arylsulfatase A-like enzyme
MVTRRAVLGALAGTAGVRGNQKRRPNLLFILADDHAGYVFGADGNRTAQTPNLDRLATQSTRFAQHFCNSPICTPSRQSIFTGQMPHMAGVTRLMTPLADDKPTLAWQLRKAGYLTAVFGKMHFQKPPFPLQHGFDLPITEYAIDHDWAAVAGARTVPPEIRTKPLPWRPFKVPARTWLNADHLPYPRYYEGMKGTYIARQAERFLEEHRDRPFALWVSFMEPHSPFDFPVEDRARYSSEQFPPPRVGPEDPWQIPLVFRDLTDADKRGIAAAYYTSVQFLDRNVGVVLEKLRRLNLENDTYVIYTADHGYMLGQHGRFEKHCGYDPALRIPLLMRWPGRTRQGVIADMTEHIDLPATILDMLDVEPLPVEHGHTLRPYLEKGRMEKPRDHIFSEYLDNEEAYIRTAQYKFIYCTGTRRRTEGFVTADPTPGRYTRLYDLAHDPGEFTDVSRQHPDLVKKYEALMLKRFRDTHPDASHEPQHLGTEDALDFYLRPRDA